MKNFTKLILAFAFVAGSFSFANAQFEEGQSDINVGIGFVTFGLTGESVVPPVSLSYEYGINDNVGVGVFGGYTSAKDELTDITFTYLLFGLRGSYHFEIIDDFDTYAGILIGYNQASLDTDDAFLNEFFTVGGVLYGGYAGGRYHFTDNIGAFLEIGYGVSAVNIGATFKF